MIVVNGRLDSVFIDEGYIVWVTDVDLYRFQDIVFLNYQDYYGKSGFIYYQHPDTHWMILE